MSQNIHKYSSYIQPGTGQCRVQCRVKLISSFPPVFALFLSENGEEILLTPEEGVLLLTLQTVLNASVCIDTIYELYPLVCQVKFLPDACIWFKVLQGIHHNWTHCLL